MNLYRLKEDAQNPEDGEFLGKKLAYYDYAGFHRESLKSLTHVLGGLLLHSPKGGVGVASFFNLSCWKADGNHFGSLDAPAKKVRRSQRKKQPPLWQVTVVL